MKNPHPIPTEEFWFAHFRDFVYATCTRYGNKTAITQYTRKGEKHSYTFAQLQADVYACGQQLHALGFCKAQIAIVATNCYEWLVAYLGIITSGNVAVCVDADQSDAAIQEMIAYTDCQFIFAGEEYVDICKDLQGQTSGVIQGVVQFDYAKNTAENAFAMFLQKGRLQDAEAYKALVVDPEDVASIVFTSGTTSAAKPVMLTHRGIMNNAAVGIIAAPVFEKGFCPLPFYHAFAMTCAVLGCLMLGYNLCINGDLKNVMRDIALFKPEAMVAVPLFIEAMHKQIWASIEKGGKAKTVRLLINLGVKTGNPARFMPKKVKQAIASSSLGSMHTILCGGAHLRKQVAQDMFAFGILVLPGYGITECGPLVTAHSPIMVNFAAVGHVVPGYEIKFVDDEIWVKGNALMKGYYKNEALTNAVMEDGWLKTGDIGYQDKKNHLFITGRTKNIIVMQNGKKVSPEEIEHYLQEIPLVKEAVAYSASNSDCVDDVYVAAMIYPDPAQTEGLDAYDILRNLQEAVDEVNKKLPVYKQVQMIHVRETEFEKTASKKIRRELIAKGGTTHA